MGQMKMSGNIEGDVITRVSFHFFIYDFLLSSIFFVQLGNFVAKEFVVV